jgi:hypothetical protein
MLVKASTGLLPQLNPIRDVVTVADKLTGADFPLLLGWFGHFFLGTIAWGLVYAWLEGQLPGSPLVKGLAFGICAWLAMMVFFMPLAGEGFFGLKDGPPAADAVLIEAGSRILPSFQPSLSPAAQRALQQFGVDVRLGEPVTLCDAEGVVVARLRRRYQDGEDGKSACR